MIFDEQCLELSVVSFGELVMVIVLSLTDVTGNLAAKAVPFWQVFPASPLRCQLSSFGLVVAGRRDGTVPYLPDTAHGPLLVLCIP